MKTYKIKVALMKDAMSPNIMALILDDVTCSTRLTPSKGCGSWNLVKNFEVTITQEELDSHNLLAKDVQK